MWPAWLLASSQVFAPYMHLSCITMMVLLSYPVAFYLVTLEQEGTSCGWSLILSALALACILCSVKHKLGREPPLCRFEIPLAYYSGMLLVAKLTTPRRLSEHFPDQTGLLLKRDSPSRKVRSIFMLLHSDCVEMKRGWGENRGHFNFMWQSDGTSHSFFRLYWNITSFS